MPFMGLSMRAPEQGCQHQSTWLPLLISPARNPSLAERAGRAQRSLSPPLGLRNSSDPAPTPERATGAGNRTRTGDLHLGKVNRGEPATCTDARKPRADLPVLPSRYLATLPVLLRPLAAWPRPGLPHPLATRLAVGGARVASRPENRRAANPAPATGSAPRVVSNGMRGSR